MLHRSNGSQLRPFGCDWKVDLYPTLADLAGLPAAYRPALCPPPSPGRIVTSCTEGHSAAGLLLPPAAGRGAGLLQTKTAAFSQYPRPSLTPQNNSELPNLRDIRYMGASLCASRRPSAAGLDTIER